MFKSRYVSCSTIGKVYLISWLLSTLNTQNYGGVGGRGEMSKSIEKQIDVYTKTREDIRRILDVAKKCSVAQRVKLLDNQQIDTDTVIDKDTDKRQEVVVGTQVSGGLKSRYDFV